MASSRSFATIKEIQEHKYFLKGIRRRLSPYKRKFLAWKSRRSVLSRSSQGLPLRSRDDLPSLLRYLGLNGVGYEVGVALGDYSLCILERSRLSRLVLVDPWAEMDAKKYDDVFNVPQTEADKRFEYVKNRFERFGERVQVLRMFSTGAAECVAPESLDFVYIDANHAYDACVEDLALWWPKVKPGGLFAGHDYMDCFLPEYGEFRVKPAVDEFVAKTGAKLMLTLDSPPSWYLFKERRSPRQAEAGR